MKHVIVMTAAALALASCNKSEAQAKEIVRANINDPDSAKFGSFEVVESKNRDWACLEVNYKGPEGGYVGNSAARFVKAATGTEWKYQGIAGTQAECVKMIHDMQPFEGGAR